MWNTVMHSRNEEEAWVSYMLWRDKSCVKGRWGTCMHIANSTYKLFTRTIRSTMDGRRGRALP
jgi:hypothetical protein